jgi:hypothetical protein
VASRPPRRDTAGLDRRAARPCHRRRATGRPRDPTRHHRDGADGGLPAPRPQRGGVAAPAPRRRAVGAGEVRISLQ